MREAVKLISNYQIEELTADDLQAFMAFIDEESKYIEEISVRYQLIGGGGIRMSGIDVEDMTKQVKEKSAKHKKK